MIISHTLLSYLSYFIIVIVLLSLFSVKSIRGQTDSVRIEAEKILAESDITFKEGNYQASAEGYIKASQLFYEIGDSLLYLSGKINYAKSLYFSSQSIKAIDLAISVDKEFEEITEQKTENYIRLLRDIGILFVLSRQELPAGEKRLQKAAELLEQTNIGDIYDRIENYSNLAGIQYYLRKLSDAENNYIKAQNLALADSAAKKSHVPNIVLGRSIVQSDAGKYQQAIAGFNHILELAIKANDKGREGWILTSMALIFRGQGFYYKAIEYYKEAIRIFESAGLYNDPNIIEAKMKIAGIHVELKKSRQAITQIKEVHEIEKEQLGANHPNHIYTFSALSRAYQNINVDSARLFLEKEKQMILRHYGDSTILYATVHEKIADSDLERGDFKIALSNYQLVLKKRTELLKKNNPKTLEILYKVGLTHYLLGDFETSLKLIDQLKKDGKTDFDTNKVSLKYANPEMLIASEALKASVLYEKYKSENDPSLLKASISTFKNYDSLINLYRREVGYSLDKSTLWDNYRENIDKILPLLVHNYEIENDKNSFENLLLTVDKFKYITLTERLNGRQQSGFGNDKLAEQKRGLLNQISQAKSELLNLESTSEEAKQVSSRLFQINETLESIASNETSNKTENIDLGEIAPILDQSTLISYYLTDEKLYILLLSDQEQEVKEIPLDEDFFKDLDNFYLMTTNPQSSNIDRFKKLGKRLYDYLIAPINQHITKSHIIIFPDQNLHQLPFDALITQETDADLYKELPYLIKDLEISYAPSLSTLALLNDKRKTRYNNPIAIVPNFNQTQVKKQEISFSRVERAGYTELFWTKHEAQLVSDLFDGRVLNSTEADKSYIKSQLSSPLILHFATHSIMDDQNADYSHLILNTSDSIDNEANKLFGFEIHNAKIATEMAVLSACNTGNGKLNEGEGILSLANSFFHAGAKSVLFSLWLANDQSTYEIMKSFYSHLANSETKSHALRKAKIEYISTTNELTAHPFYWSHLVVSGKNSAIDHHTGNFKLFVLAIVLISFIAFLFFRTRNRLKT